MYIVLSYDISSKKASKVKKICDKYLFHIQKSVYEGEITEKNLSKLKNILQKTVDPSCDSVIIFKFNSFQYAKRESIGITKNTDVQIL